MSYGSIESEEVQSDMQSFNTAAMKLGAQGLSILIASGDDGVANFNARSNPSACGFNPSYPATVPYVTAVGATQGPEAGTTEVACSSKTGGLITTGGGFSAVFSQPSYQAAAVNAYFKSNVPFPPSSQYNGAGRGYPDVALVGHNFDVCIAGQFYQVSGTSASTPTTAAMITLINDARLSAGKSSLGFLNPLLYDLAGNATTASPFNDITSGENNCCAGNVGQETCCKYGFTAATGWDPLTGWGSINFANLLSAAQ
jgi:tripeptidyl-peptidase-1